MSFAGKSRPALRRFGMAFLYCAVAAAPALAQRELRIKTLPETPLPFVTTVIAPAAKHLAINEAAGVIAVGHRPKSPAHISLFRLDAQGQIVPGEPVAIALPKPATFGERPNFVLGLASHPTLPLLYVWQDVEPLPENKPTDPAVFAEFDHLLVYGLDEPQPKLIFAAARGIDYTCGVQFGAGGFVLNASATRLYAPNMEHRDLNKKVTSAIGWFTLDPDGLPAFAPPGAPAEDPSATVAPAAPLDSAAAAASRTAKLAAVEQAKTAGQPLVLRRYLEPTTTFASPPAPYCYAPLNDDIVFLTGHSGAVSWVLSDRLGRFCYFYLQPYVPYRYRITVHPTAPSVYVTMVAYDGRIVRMAHSDGQFTLTPQTLTIDPAVYHSTALVLEQTNQLAFGANGKVILVDLDAEGKFKPSAAQMTVNNPTVEAIAWSKKFGKLYVPVEKLP